MQPTVQAAGGYDNDFQAPEGRQKLTPDIFLVVGNVVILEEGDKLLLKRMLLVVFFLVGDIFCDGGDF